MRLFVATVCGLIASAAIVRADPAAFQVVVRAPDNSDCITAQALTERVAERTGRPVADDGPLAQLSVQVVIERAAEGHRAQVVVRDASGLALGQREVAETGACSALDDLLTLVIVSSLGVMTDALVQPAPVEPLPPVPEPPPPEPAPPEPARPTPSAPPRFVSAPVDEPATPVRWVFDLEASARGLTGVLPKPSVGAALALFAGHGDLVLGVAAAWLVPTTLREGNQLELRATGAWAELSACGQLVRASLWLCAGAQAGMLRADARQLWHTAPRWDPLVQLTPSMRARVPLLDDFGLALGCGAAIPVVFPRYSYVDAAGEVATYYEVELGVWAELGIWARLN